jgi:MFS family permease
MMCVTCLNNVICFSLAPVSHYAHEYYANVDLGLLASIFFLSNVLFSYHGAKLVDHWGLYRCVLLGSLLQTAGCWLRYVDDVGFHRTLYAGQFLAALSQSFVTNVGTAVSMAWFGEDETAMATSLQGGSNQLGIAVAYIWASQMVGQSADVSGYMRSVAIVTTVVTLLILVFFRSAPESPPSRSAQLIAERGPGKGQFGIKYIGELCRQPGFLLTVVGFTAVEALLNCYSTFLDSMFFQYGYHSTFIGWCVRPITLYNQPPSFRFSSHATVTPLIAGVEPISSWPTWWVRRSVASPWAAGTAQLSCLGSWPPHFVSTSSRHKWCRKMTPMLR